MSNNRDVNLNEYYSGNHGPIRKRKANKKSRFKKWWRHRTKGQKGAFIGIVSLFCAVIIGVVGIGSYLFIKINQVERDDDFNNMDQWELGFQSVIDANIYNIALFGVDSRKVGNFDGNSDSIMILSINRTENTIRLVSVMRDSLVPYEKGGKTGYTKITETHGYGGPALAVKTLNTVFGLDIAEYATVNFYGMSDIIDAVGGIDCDLTYDEVRAENPYGINAMIGEQCGYLNLDPSDYYVMKTGVQHLNGLQAVAYGRIRHGKNFSGANDDFGRTERQRYIMQQLLSKALSMDIASYPKFIDKMVPYVKTSLNNKELLSLAYFLIGKPQMTTSRIPMDEYIINADYRGTGSSTVYYNYEYAGKALRAFLYDGISQEDYMAQNGVDLTKWYGAGDKYTSTPSNGTSSGISSGTTSSQTTSSSQKPESTPQTPDTDTSEKPTSSTSQKPESGTSEKPTSSSPQNPDDKPTQEQ